MTAEGLLCRVYLGWSRSHPSLRKGVLSMAEDHPPSIRRPNIYYWYYATQVLHHYGGTPWRNWNLQMRDVLVDSEARVRLCPMDDFGYFPLDPALQHLHQTWSGCMAGIEVIGIRSNGDVLGCLSLGDDFVEANVRQRPLAEIWRDVLRVDTLGVHDDFLELGGDSIQSIQVVARARRAGIRLAPKQLFDHPTIAGLAPLMLEKSFQAQFLIPMAISIAFGLAIGTVLTLVLLPIFYMIFEDVRRAVRWLWTGHYGDLDPAEER